MLRYALYARKSDEDKKVTEKSITEQVQELQSLAARDGLLVLRCFEESKSAKAPGVRPRYNEMLRLIERGEINAILCWKINRLVRNMKEGGALAQLLIDGKLQEIRTPHGLYRPGDNILPLVLEAATSTQYSLDLKQNVQRGMNGHFERGGLNYKARQGYRNERDPLNLERGVVVPDGHRFTLMRKGWDMLLTGAYTPIQVIDVLNNVWHYRTRKTESRGGGPLSRSAAYALFSDPFYAGFVRYKGQIRRGQHKPMVTEAEFQTVQQHLRQFGHRQQRHGTREYAYTGLMRCGYCGRQITAERHTLKSGAPYTFYRCSDPKGTCTKKGMSEPVIEREIVQRLESITIDPTLCQIALENIVRSLETKSGDAEAIYAQQNQTLVEVEGQLIRLEEMWLRGLMTDERRYKQREGELREQRDKLVIQAERSRSELEAMRQNARSAVSYIRYAREHFLVGDPRRKREIAHALGACYVFFGREKTLKIEQDPLLVEVVKFAKEIQKAAPLQSGVFEPAGVGSGKPKEAPAVASISFGGTDETGVEAPEVLLDLLRSSHFPLLHLQG